MPEKIYCFYISKSRVAGQQRWGAQGGAGRGNRKRAGFCHPLKAKPQGPLHQGWIPKVPPLLNGAFVEPRLLMRGPRKAIRSPIFSSWKATQ